MNRAEQIQMVCPHCQREATFPDQWAGRKVKCGSCRRMFDLPTLGQLQHAEEVRRGLHRPPSLRLARVAVWILRSLWFICWLTALWWWSGGSGQSGLAVVGLLVAGGWMLFLGEMLRLRIAEIHRSLPR